MWSTLTSVMTSYYGKLFVIDMGIQWVGWLFAVTFKTEKFYDLTGSMTFIILTYMSFESSPKSLRQIVQSDMVIAWAFRLGLFLFTRILKDGKDKRFDKAKNSPLTFMIFWTIQGFWIYVTLLPTLMLNNTSAGSTKPVGTQDYVGWGIWFLGMFFEVVADFQKSSFKSNPDNKDKFIQSGLWSISRHPNYFGEILLWFGLYISASSSFNGAQYFAVTSPVAVYLLITKVSGIPLLEKSSLKKWGELPEYQQYLKTTPILIPFVGKQKTE